MLSFILEHSIFFIYAGMTFVVCVISILWGNQSKITAASLLLASVIVVNILYGLYQAGLFSMSRLLLISTVYDLGLGYVFAVMARGSCLLERNRWAAALATIQLGMCAADLFSSVFVNSKTWANYALTLNLLAIGEYIVCLIAFTPKSRDEALGVLKLKWLYLKADIFGRSALMRLWARGKRPGGEKQLVVRSVDIHIGARLREARVIRGVSREELARRLGVSVAQIQKYESGANRLSASALFALSQYLETDVRFFYEGLDGKFRLRTVKS